MQKRLYSVQVLKARPTPPVKERNSVMNEITKLYSIPVSAVELSVSPIKEINNYLQDGSLRKDAEVALLLWRWQKDNRTLFKEDLIDGNLIDESLIQLLYLGARRCNDPLKNALKVAAYSPSWWERFKRWCKDLWEGVV